MEVLMNELNLTKEDREVIIKVNEMLEKKKKEIMAIQIDDENIITGKESELLTAPSAAFLNVMAPCPRGGGYATEDLMEINKLAVDTCYWPLYEVENGKYKINYKPAKKLPIEEFLKPQRRFKHMFKPGNEWMIEQFQKELDERWETLLKLEEITNRE